MTPGSAAAPVSCVAFRADGRRLAIASYDRGLLVQDTSDPSRPHLLTEIAHRSPVLAAAFDPAAADLLATGTADGSAVVWRVVDGRPPHAMKVLGGHPAAVTGVHWMPDGQHLLCRLADGRAAVWQAFGETWLGTVDDCVRLDVSSGGLIATVGADGMVAVRDLARDPMPTATRAARAVEACAWSPDGGTLALARRDGAIELRNVHLDLIRTVRPTDAPLRAVTWASDGAHLIAGAYDGTLLAVDATRTIWRHTDPAVRPQSLAVGGPVLATASFGSRPCLIDTATGAPLSGSSAASPHRGPAGLPPGGPAGLSRGGPAGLLPGGAAALPPGGPAAAMGDAVAPVGFRDGVVAAAGRTVTAGPPAAPAVIVEHDLRVGAVDVLADRVVASGAHHAVRLTRLAPQAYQVERAITLHSPEPVRTVALLGTPEVTVVVAASYDFRLFAWTVDWIGPPVGPRLAGESAAGIAALQRLDEHRLTATDHRGELMILALGADGAFSARPADGAYSA